MKATPASLAQRRADLAKIHIARQQIGMSEDEYRDLIFAMFGKRSAADLDYRGRAMLLAHFKKIGWKPKGQRPGQAHKPLAQDKASIERKIAWQLGQLGKGWDYVYTIWENNWKHEASAFEMLSVERLGDISSALARIIEDVISLHDKWHCALWVVEAVQFQEFFRTELVKRSAQRGRPVPARAVTPATDKLLHIETLQPHMANGLIKLHPSQTTLIDQLRHFPKADHDDGPDALHMLWMAAVSGGLIAAPQSSGARVSAEESVVTSTGWGTIAGAQDFGGYV